jgi:hypothetical protein
MSTLNPSAFHVHGLVPCVKVSLAGGGEHPKTLPPKFDVNVNVVASAWKGPLEGVP